VGAWFGGLGPGLLATVLATMVADYFFLPPVGAFIGPTLQAVPLVLFALEGLLISSLVAALRSARERAQMSAQETRNHQESLRRSEERFRIVIEGVKDYAIFMLDPEGRVATWNEGSERIYGYTAEEIVGEHFAVYTGEGVKRGHVEELAVAAEEGHYEEEGVRVRKNGSRFWASVLITALRDEEGNLKGFSKVVRDITERKEGERALIESEQRFRALVQNSSDVITVIDAEGTIRYVSPAVERLMGYRPEELVGKSIFYYVRPHNLEEAQNIFAELWLRPGVHPPFEFEVPHKDGSWRHAEFLVNNLLNDSRIRGVIVNQRDITERKRAEVALRTSEAKYRTLVEQMPAVTYIEAVDPGKRKTDLLYVSPQIAAMFGYSPEEWMADPELFEKLLHPDDRKRVLDEDARTDETGESFSVEYRQITRDGRVIWLQDEVTLVRDEEGRPLFWQGLMHDVTDQKRAEERLRSTLASLLALYEAGKVLGASLQREEIGSGLLEIVERILGLEVVIIALRDGQGGLKEWRGVGPEAVLASVREEPQARSASREVSEGGGIRSLELRLTGDSGAERRLRGLFVPLLVRDRVIGVLEAYGPQALVESEAAETLGSLASQAASALENARLYEELSEHKRQLQDMVGQMVIAQEEEHRRVAYGLHDGLTQLVVAAYQRLQVFAEDHPSGSAEGREELEDIVGLVRRAVGEARRVIADLRPTTLDDLGLAAAVRVQLDNLRAEGYETSYEQALGEEHVPTVVETTLFRVAQEALTNTRKHARADRVHIALERRDGAVRLEVRDWGRGFDPSRVGNGGGPGERVGLSSMRARIALLGGDFEIRSAPGEGTSVVAEIPLPQKMEREGNHGR
jgi:PAS domain S-box-containing protein